MNNSTMNCFSEESDKNVQNVEESNKRPSYEIKESHELGLYMIASKDLEIGEIIFEEYPLVTNGLSLNDPVDSDNSLPLCIECYEITLSKCENCNVPLCESHVNQENDDGNEGIVDESKMDKGLQQKIQHHGTLECELLNQFLFQNKNIYDSSQDILKRKWSIISSHLFLLRSLFLEPLQYNKLLSLESNIDKWTKSPLSEQFQNEYQILKQLLGSMINFPSEEEIRLIKAIHDINSYEIILPTCQIQATYYLASRLEHNCIRNTHRVTESKTLKLTVRASQKITKGSHITTTYSDLFWPTVKRQKYFQTTKFFTCSCNRCLDPTECGSLLSAFLCPICPQISPLLQGKQQLDSNLTLEFKTANDTTKLNFICINCNNMIEYEEAMTVLKNAKYDHEILEESDSADEDLNAEELNAIPNLINWLKNWTHAYFLENAAQNNMISLASNKHLKLKLHPQNTLVLDVCHTIFLLYSLPNEINNENEVLLLNNDELECKIKLGEHLLASMTSITPGISKFRATLMHDLAKAKILYKIRSLDGEEERGQKKWNLENYNHFKDSLKMWEEALSCLQYEPLNTPEKTMHENGKQEYEKCLEFFNNRLVANEE